MTYHLGVRAASASTAEIVEALDAGEQEVDDGDHDRDAERVTPVEVVSSRF